jgi:chromosome segregation ATPase
MSQDAVHATSPQPDSADASVPDERDENIAQLERTLAQERQNAGTLRATVDDLRFKLDILEKSYSKQLADARQGREAAEEELAAARTRAAELGTGGEDTLKLLESTRAELARVSAERDDLRSRLVRSEKREPSRTAKHDDPAAHDRTMTIDDMLATSTWRIERRAAGEGHLNAQVREEPEAPVEMIDPELVFTKGKGGGKDDEDSR